MEHILEIKTIIQADKDGKVQADIQERIISQSPADLEGRLEAKDGV